MGHQAKMLLALGVAVALVPNAPAGLLTFTSQAEFQAVAPSPLNHVDFSGIAAPSDFQEFPPPAGITRFPLGHPGLGVNFSLDSTADDGTIFVVGPDFFYPKPAITSQQSTLGANNLVITLPGPVKAAGLTVNSFFGSDFQISLSNGFKFTTPTPSNTSGYGFVGVLSDVPFSSLRVDIALTNDLAQSDAIISSDFYFSDVLHPTPLPGTFMLFAGGAVGLVVRRGARKKK